MAKAAFTSQLDSKSFALLGNVICTVMLSGNDTDGQIGLVEIFCPQGAGPSPHTDPWRESFYVIEGEIEFMIESEGLLKPRIANAGDSVSIPAGLGHAFRAVSQSARALIISAPAGLEAFFADAGEPLSGKQFPPHPVSFDRERFQRVTDRYGIKMFRERGRSS